MKGSPQAVAALLDEAGWRLVGSAEASMALIECVECEARFERTWSAVYSGLRPCKHPAVDDARRYIDDTVCRRLRLNYSPMSLKEIGDALKITGERARQVFEGALPKLIEPLEQEGYDRETVMEHLHRAHQVRPEKEHRSESRRPERLAEYNRRWAERQQRKGGQE